MTQLYSGPARLPEVVSTIRHEDQNGRKQKTRLKIDGTMTQQATVLPGEHNVTVFLTKRIPVYGGGGQASGVDERSEGLTSGDDNFEVRTRSHTKPIAFSTEPGKTYLVSARWISAADKNDPLWFDSMKGERIRVWVTDALTGELITAEPSCKSTKALPDISSSACWYYPPG